MANGQGGMRTPRNPAPVSGPGQLSQRTDGGPQQTQATMTGMPYGENAEFNTMQAAAPMSAAGQTTARAPRPRQARGGQAAMVPLFSPTQRPDEPVTAGAPFGPGDGPPPTTATPTMRQMGIEEARSLVESIPALEQAANSEYGTDSFRRFVEYVKSVAM
jgi:hypothetical protein